MMRTEVCIFEVSIFDKYFSCNKKFGLKDGVVTFLKFEHLKDYSHQTLMGIIIGYHNVQSIVVCVKNTPLISLKQLF